MDLKSCFFCVWIPANKFTTPAPDVINPDCDQWITFGIFLQIASSQQVDIGFPCKNIFVAISLYSVIFLQDIDMQG